MGRGTLEAKASPAPRVFRQEPIAAYDPASPRHPRGLEIFFQLALVGMIQFGFVALNSSGYLDIISWNVCFGVLLIRGLMAARAIPVGFGSTGMLIGSLVAVAFFLFDLALLSGYFSAAAIHFTLMLAGLRIISARSDRDCFHVQILALLALVLGGILSPGPKFLAFFAGFLISAIASMVASEMRAAWRYPGAVVGLGRLALPLRLGGSALLVAFLILTAAAGLFYILPRTDKESIWDRRGGTSYFAESVGLDDIGSIKLQQKPVLHIRMLSEQRPPVHYWRGSALILFDGKHWYNLPARPTQEALVPSQPVQVGPRGPSGAVRFHYEVEFQGLVSNLLFLADRPEFVAVQADRVTRGPGDSIRMIRNRSTRGYVGYSYVPPAGMPPVPLTEDERISYTILPAPDPRVRQLAVEFTAGFSGAEMEARAIESRLKRDYTYTLELPRSVPRDPIAHFLLERRRGHCEFFASAMAVLLRLRGIPARVAVGFQASQRPLVNGWSIVRASDAHSWVEAWIPDKGWTTFDPTPPDPNASEAAFDRQMARLRDAVELFWDRWVADYDLRRQVTLAIEMQRSGRDAGGQWLDRLTDAANWFDSVRESPEKLIRFLPVAALALLLAGLLAWRLLHKRIGSRLDLRRIRRGGSVNPHDATILYEQMLIALRRHAVEKPVWLTPAEFARIVPSNEVAPVVRDFTDAYNEMRFGGNPKVAPKMVALIEQLQKTPVTREPAR